ncbi:MAG: holo-[acyl-carrier-protein] synthase [uncultured bacterium]|nr:MAG: holo-[acyl-carrier-protein] synthase [uncultured bacterium]
MLLIQKDLYIMMSSRKTNISGIGTDIIEIERLRNSYLRKGQAFIDKLFTDDEKKYCLKYKDPIPHFAARFAAKEAVVKALGIGFGKEISFLDIEIVNESNGKPIVIVSENAKKNFNYTNILISISHSEKYATAFCLIQ